MPMQALDERRFPRKRLTRKVLNVNWRERKVARNEPGDA
jgi:hypothetical protein